MRAEKDTVSEEEGVALRGQDEELPDHPAEDRGLSGQQFTPVGQLGGVSVPLQHLQKQHLQEHVQVCLQNCSQAEIKEKTPVYGGNDKQAASHIHCMKLVIMRKKIN